MTTQLSENARRVFAARYSARDESGEPRESFDEMCARVARSIAEVESEFGCDPAPAEESFRDLLRRREFLPNSPTLMNAGTSTGQLAACYVLPVEDDLGEIFDSIKRMALVQQSGGGTGFSLSKLRPAADAVGDAHGIAAGPVRFLAVFDAVAGTIRQGARRQGANMGVLRIDHPDIMDFVRLKEEEGRLANFNLSVAIPDSFFHCLSSGESFDLKNPRTGRVVRRVKPRELLDQIASSAWTCGDPGALYVDEINRLNPTPRLGRLEATNPCGELPLLDHESCNLGSLRLDVFASESGVDWARLDRAVDLAVRFLDDVIQRNDYPLPETKAISRANRKIGLGVMGFADLLVDLGVPYDSSEAVRVAESIMSRVQARAERASEQLSLERGVFDNFVGSVAESRGLRRRNATLTSIAPTGSLSLLADCSPGIEPYFALAFVRNVLDGEQLVEVNPRFERALRRAGAWSEDLIAEMLDSGTVRATRTVPDSIRRLFPTALEISPSWHLAIQAAFQKHVDNAVSKTINLPSTATPGDIKEIYCEAWKRGLKGVTVFREGCKADAAQLRGAQGVSGAPDRCVAC